MGDENGIFIGLGGGQRQLLNLKRANRHGLIAGATGTGKTVTLQSLAEGFSRAGVPVFVSDVKGDLAGMAMAGSAQHKMHDILAARAAEIGDSDWQYRENPVQFWDLFGEQGHPIRTTISEMGPLLLARLMNLNEVQEGVLTIAFHIADKDGLLLLDLDDLQSMLVHIADRADEISTSFGNVSKQSVGTIQRALLQLRSQGGDHFFGEPALNIADFIACDESGRGIINILAADRLMASPKLYSTFLLWLMSELFEQLPEIGDPDKPKLVFFFDEAHLLFDEAPKALLDKIEQVVRLIRSKGVGIYFVTQNPIDIPEDVAAQLGNRVQHALRSFTPRDEKAIRMVAETFRANPGVDVATIITELKVGEALVSLLQADGAPSPVERTLIRPPCSRLGPLNADERGVMIQTDAIGDRYDAMIDRESAEELLHAKSAEAAAAAAESAAQEAEAKVAALEAKEEAKARVIAEREAARQAKETERAEARAAREAAKPGIVEKIATSAARSAASSLGRQLTGQVGRSLIRGLLGGLFKGR
ncbi:helicase HerA-like domain-containing protein [Aquisediminimonas sediminicola]|uniref:helicase HerA-like domain-containing protein n=1 Tax=Alteraquisediminimonas sediminicola TaxID=2676787 RepID=UPI001C8EB508|nr:helicase HerA-like domain-containing protein [Aquisediminimonas sediminicola]